MKRRISTGLTFALVGIVSACGLVNDQDPTPAAEPAPSTSPSAPSPAAGSEGSAGDLGSAGSAEDLGGSVVPSGEVPLPSTTEVAFPAGSIPSSTIPVFEFDSLPAGISLFPDLPLPDPAPHPNEACRIGSVLTHFGALMAQMPILDPTLVERYVSAHQAVADNAPPDLASEAQLLEDLVDEYGPGMTSATTVDEFLEAGGAMYTDPRFKQAVDAFVLWCR